MKRLENYHKWGLFREAMLVRITSDNKAVSDLCAIGNAQLLLPLALLEWAGISIDLSTRLRKEKERWTTSSPLGRTTKRRSQGFHLRRRSQHLPTRDGGRWQVTEAQRGLPLPYGLRREW